MEQQQSAVPTQHGGDPPNEPAHAFLDLAEQLDWNAVEAAVVADPSLVSAQPGRRLSALHHAARANDGDAVTMLLRHQANPFAVSVQNETPRELATSEEIVKLLLQAERDAKAPARRKRRPRPDAEVQEQPRTFTQNFAVATEVSPIVGERSAVYTRGADLTDVLAGLEEVSGDEQAAEHYGAEEMQKQFASLRELLTRELSQDFVGDAVEPEPESGPAAAGSANPAPLQVSLPLCCGRFATVRRFEICSLTPSFWAALSRRCPCSRSSRRTSSQHILQRRTSAVTATRS